MLTISHSHRKEEPHKIQNIKQGAHAVTVKQGSLWMEWNNW